MKLERIRPQDYPGLRQLFGKQAYRLCVYSLPSLLSWSNSVYQPYAAISDDVLTIAAEYDEAHRKDRHLILPVSPTKQFAPDELADIAEKLGYTAYWFVPEDYIRQFGEEQIGRFFEISEQIGFADYIYLKEDLAELKGNKYSKKRNLIHQFDKEYVQTNRIKTEPITPALASECLIFLDEWCEERDCGGEKQDDLACEKQAAANMIRHIGEFDVKGLATRIDGKIGAFGIASRLTEEIGVLHFEKALAAVKGLYQYFDNLCAKTLFNGHVYINKESDMNVPGLMQAKKSYHPAMMVKSYTLTLR